MNILRKITVLGLSATMLFCTACSDKNRGDGAENETGGLVTGGSEDNLRIEEIIKQKNDISTLEYQTGDDEVIITGFNGKGGVLEIPSEIEGLPVKTISDGAFQSESALYELSLPDTVVYIADSAFKNCENLINIKFPAALNHVGAEAFDNTAWLKKQPDGFVIIGDELVYTYNRSSSDTMVDELRIPEGVKYFTVGWWFPIASVNKLYVSSTVESFYGKEEAFSREVSLDEAYALSPPLQINERIEISPDNAYLSSRDGVLYDKSGTVLLKRPSGSGEKSFTVPDGVTSIADLAFNSDSTLETVKLPDSLTIIGPEAFSICTALTEIEIPSSVKEIRGCAFSGCEALKTVKFSEGLELLGDGAFNDCSLLTDVKLPKSLTDVSSSSFDGTQWYSKAGDWLIAGDGILMKCQSDKKELTVPSGVKKLAAYVFCDMQTLTSVRLPDGLEYIGIGAFTGCSITALSLPESVKEIDDHAFSNSSLTKINLPSGLKKIGNAAFSVSNLESITIPANIEEMEEGVFSECASLARVTFAQGSTLRYVPDACFRNCLELAEITLPATIERIGRYSFSECHSLDKLVLGEPSALKQIGAFAFEGSKISVNEIKLPDGVIIDEGLHG